MPQNPAIYIPDEDDPFGPETHMDQVEEHREP